MSLIAADLGYRAGGHQLLDGVSLRLEPGRLFAVLGPNGAGKSTLLKLLAGDQPPHNGTVSLDGQALDMWNRRALARRRAVVGQRDSLGFSFTAEEVVRLGRLPYTGESIAHQTEGVTQALRQLDVLHLAQRHYPTLSGGERARVQLARAMVQLWTPAPGTARYLLLDEPTASQDLAHQHHCLRVLRDLSRQNVAVLVVLHDPNLVLDYADEVLVLCQGRSVGQGTPTEVLSAELLGNVYGVDVQIANDAATGRRWVQVRMDTPASKSR